LKQIAEKYRELDNTAEAERYEQLALQKEKTVVNSFIAKTWVEPGSFFDKEPDDEKMYYAPK